MTDHNAAAGSAAGSIYLGHPGVPAARIPTYPKRRGSRGGAPLKRSQEPRLAAMTIVSTSADEVRYSDFLVAPRSSRVPEAKTA